MSPDFYWHNDFNNVYMYIDKKIASNPFDKEPIYLNNKYLKQIHKGIVLSFKLSRCSNPETLAVFHISSSDLINWNSLPKSPFGGVFYQIGCEQKEVLFLLFCAENFIKNIGGKRIIIRSPPDKYDILSNRLLTYCYANTGYKTLHNHKNHIIPVTKSPFEAIIKKQESRRLTKCINAGFTVLRETGTRAISTFNSMCSMRQVFGYNTSITAAEFANLAELFPEKIYLFAAYDCTKVIAVSVTVRVNEGVIYNFLSGYSPDYKKFSPVILLLQEVYRLSQNEKVQMLDLGISVDHLGQEKPGLIRFKENIGGELSFKTTWEKHLDAQTVIGPVENR